MSNKDYYAILGVAKNAGKDEIKKAYRSLSMKYHPDRNHGDKIAEDKFKEINEAYSVLSDDNKRREYDNPAPFGDIFSGFDPFSFMRKGARQDFNAPMQGRPLQVEAILPLHMYLFGGKLDIDINFADSCEVCRGKGYIKAETCDLCNGSGFIQLVERRENFMSTTSQPCSKCRGRGVIPKDICDKCGGAGNLPAQRKLSVDIPEQVVLGNSFTLYGVGRNGSNGGPKGDIIVHIVDVDKSILGKIKQEDKAELLNILSEKSNG